MKKSTTEKGVVGIYDLGLVQNSVQKNFKNKRQSAEAVYVCNNS